MDYYAILTATGAEKLAETQAQGEALELATFAVGDGNGNEYEPTATQTALRHQTWSGGVSRVYHSATDANVVCIEGAIPTNVGGFTIREVGIFDGDGDLIFVANEPSIVKAATTESFYNDLVLKIEIGFSSDVNITVTASTVALATAADLDALRTETTANLEALRDDVDELIDNVHSVPIDGTQGQVLIKGAGETYGWGDNDIVAIDVTYPSVFAGTVMTLRGNGQTVTSTLDSNGRTMFLSRTLGTYTVSDNVTGQTTTINATQTGGYNVTLDKPYVTVTLTDNAFIGETLTFAGETKTVDSSLTVVFVLDNTGAYTLSNSLNSYTEVVNVTENTEYPVTLTPVVITVPLGNAAFEGETVYLDGGGTRYSETVGSNLSVSFKVGTGSYTVSNSVTSDTQTINASTAGVYTATTMNCATITVTCVGDDFLGMTIICYSSEKILSKVVGTNLTVTFAVGDDEWTVHNPIAGIDDKIVVSQYTNYTSRMFLVEIVSWANGTDEQIAAMIEAVDNGDVDLYNDAGWRVGDERQITLSAMSATGVGESHVSQTVTFVLMNRGGKTLADGTTECNFIVGMKNMLANGTSREGGYMNSSNTNSGGWEACARRTWCNNVFREAIPSTIRSIFKQHLNITANGSGSTTATSTDYFALPTEKEIFGSNTYANSTAEASNTQFEWYQTSANRNKKAGDSGSANDWWGRSPQSSLSDRFCAVSGGVKYSATASTGHGLAPFGVI